MRKKLMIGFALVMTSLFVVACTDDEQVDSNSNDQVNEEVKDHNQQNDNETDKNDVNQGEEANSEDNGNENTDSNEDNELNRVINTINIVDDHSITSLVNKQNGLDANYIPNDLVTVQVPTVLDNPEIKQMRQEAADQLAAMFTAAELENIYLHARSGYRSYQTQVQLFKNYAERHGEEAANRYSARPGYSEHQTGLVMDITSESVQLGLTEQFGNTREGMWVKDNAHHFGFIIRYPEGKEDITGYVYEPWHLRYLGVDVATLVYESGLTYEEFLVEVGIIDDVFAEKAN